MKTIAQTIRNSMLLYPNICPCPMAVSVHMFTRIGTGMEWTKHGTLECVFNESKPPKTFDDSEYRERIKQLESYAEVMPDYALSQTAKVEAEIMQRKFVFDNVDRFTNDCTLTLFEWHPTNSFTDSFYTFKDCPAFTFPDNIAKDWGESLLRFLDAWLVAMNNRYGVSNKRDMEKAVAHWPAEALAHRQRIKDAIRRLWPLVKGEDYDAYVKRSEEFSKELLKNLDK